MTTLSVNLNKIAVLRNSRGDDLPSVTEAARVCLSAGCRGITLHPRPDQRHVRPHDVTEVAALLPEGIELNMEGNPFAPANAAGYPGLLALAHKARPAQVTLVPDGDGQLTSDHGFDLRRDAERLAPLVAQFRDLGCRVSLFVDAGSQGFEHAARIGAQRIEIYTGPYAKAFARGDAGAEVARCRNTALGAQSAGLAVNAGHDLNQRNLAPFLRAVPQVLEVSIGHALIGEALYDGLAPTVRSYLAAIAAAVSPD